jgi:aminopeptidase N
MKTTLSLLAVLLLTTTAFGHGEETTERTPAALDASSRDFDQRHLDVHVVPDLAKGTVDGRVRITFSPHEDDFRVLRLHCQDTEVLGARDQDGRALATELKDDVLSIRLAEPVARAREAQVEVTYRSSPRRGLYFHRPTETQPEVPWQMYSQGQGADNRRWIPCYDEPDARGTWAVSARVPSQFQTVSNGRLAGSEEHDDGTRTDRWTFEDRGPTYLISLIVGRFETIEERWTPSSGTPVLLAYHGPPGRREELQTALGETPRMMEVFTSWCGAYPWSRYAQTFVWDFVYGGMENTTATTLNMRALHGPEVRPNYTSVPLVSHELAHMWFGDLLTCRTWQHIWLNEGFATYFTDLYYEAAEGEESFLLRRRDQNGRYRANTPEPEELGLERAVRGDLPLELHGGKQYDRGAAILHMLRREIGDEDFRNGVRSYVERFRDSCVTSEDLRLEMERAAGRDLRWFWDQWVYGAGYPVFEVRWDAGERRLHVHQVQETKGGQGLFRMTVPVRLGADGPVVPVSVHREKHAFRLPGGDAEPSFVRFGVGGDLLMNVRLDQAPEAWIAALARDPDLTGRMDAAEALESFGDEGVPALARALAEDPSWAVRSVAAEVLGRLATPDALPALVVGTRDADSRVRKSVYEALGGKERDGAGAALAAAVRSDPHPYARAEAARSLGRLKIDGAYDLLTALLDVDSHEQTVRNGALDGLRLLGDPRGVRRAIPFLDYRWGGGGTHRMRKAALDCMVALAPDARATHRRLAELLDDPYHQMRAWAAEACGTYRVVAARERLERMAEKDWHGGASSAAKTALERWK